MSFSCNVKKICVYEDTAFYELYEFLKLHLPNLLANNKSSELVNCLEDIIRCGDTLVLNLLKENNVSRYLDVVDKAYDIINNHELSKFNVCNVNYYTFFTTFGSHKLSNKLINKIKIKEQDFLVVAFEVFKSDKASSYKIFKKICFTKCLDNDIFFDSQLDYLEKSDYTTFVNCHIENIVKFSNNWLSLYERFSKAESAREYLCNLILKNYSLFIDDAKKCSKLFDIFKEPLVRNKLASLVKLYFENYLSSSEDFFYIKSLFENVSEIQDFIYKYFNDNKKYIIKRMVLKIQKKTLFEKTNQKNIELLTDVLELIIDDLCLDANVSFGDIKKIGNGAYANAYEIGDKVLKIGYKRNDKTLPDNPYALKPLLYKTFDFKDLNVMYGKDIDGHAESFDSIVIEVCKKVKPLDFNELNEEQLYEFYSKMRNVGIDWLDIKSDNLGILETDGVEATWHRKLEPSNETLGIIDNPNYKEKIELKKGDIVLLDRDIYYLIDEEYKKNISSNPLRFYWNRFRKRYDEEHRQK